MSPTQQTMPYKMRKNRGEETYYVINTKTRHKFAKNTTKSKAQRQLRLLTAIRYNPEFREKMKQQNITKKNVK